ncbi:MAG: YeeE/YedE family protein [Pseudomonadota bacterium]|nr:YeeE/YedE family protein [Pseudomonadota bacterium]
MTSFTPYTAVAGGLLIGVSALLLLLAIGRIAGITGIVFGLLPTRPGEQGWRWAFLGGLLLGTLLMRPIESVAFEPREGFPLLALLAAGFLVGYGTRMGNGCTSGHGVCGLGRRSPRSLVATVTFLTVAMMTVFTLRHALDILP